ncbi:helix-turn-helix transcriptional regulator [Microvirga sp. M2]|uniref:helix-turn-helix transcriptional regulator n=1 Tax=Microvirga sp. M2 TaxID=3073270 RepID=UPI0039C3F8AD
MLWEGASLWSFDVPAELAGQPTNRVHSHHAIQVTLSAGGRFTIQTQDKRLDGPAVLIASNVPHAFEPEGKIALLFVEPESRLGRSLSCTMMGIPATRLDASLLGDPSSNLAAIWADRRPDHATVEAMGRSVLQHIVGETPPMSTLDPRIARTLEWLAARLSGRIMLTDAASIACLSDSRFSHLFAAEVGLPFQTYLLWRRLMTAVERIASGTSLTAAAYEAGFADSAHFSRTFQRMFGIPASSLQLA